MERNVNNSKPANIGALQGLPSELSDGESKSMSLSSGQSEDGIHHMSPSSHSGLGVVFVDVLGKKSVFSWSSFTHKAVLV